MRYVKIAMITPVALIGALAGAVSAAGSTSHGVRDVSATATVPGSQLWVSHYHGSAQGTTLATSAAASPTARVVFVTGTTVELVKGSGGRTFKRHDYATVAYNAATGARIWTSRYATSGHSNRADAVAVSPDGKTVYVTGTSATPVTRLAGYDYATVAYNAVTGAQLWASRLPAGPAPFAVSPSLAVGPSGHTVYLTGSSTVKSVTGDTTIAYRAASGAQIWVRRQLINASLIASSVTASPTGRVVFVALDDTSGTATTTVAYNAATGATIWNKKRGRFATGSDGITVTVSPDGGQVFVAWTTSSQGGPAPVIVVARNAATGAAEWIREVNGVSQLENSGKALGVSPDGHTVFVTATNDPGNGAANSVTNAYDAATGAIRWSASLPSSPATSFDRASALAVNPDGKSVYITINTLNRSFSPIGFTTISYSAATGAQLWASSDTESGSQAMSAAVSADGGTAFAVGSSALGSGMEFTTIAYRA